MPVKTHERILTDTVRMRGRTNTMMTTESKGSVSTSKGSISTSKGSTFTSKRSTSTSKGSVSTSKRIDGNGKPRQHSGTTRISSGGTSVILGLHRQISNQPRPLKLITEVDDTNIDEVLNLPDLSLIPISFLAEIQQDKIYETILEELRKKISHKIPPNTLPILEEEKQKPFSPHLLAIDDDNDNDDDDDISITDEMSSSTSSEDNDISAHDDYDTDIEPEEPVMKKKHDTTGREQYRDLCQRAQIVPCSYFMAHIQDEKIILRYHQFNTEDIRAIAKTLIGSFRLESLFLDGNYLQQQSAKYISQLILKNDFITELSLADNRLGGGEGTKDICKMLSLNRHLKKINLSGNKFNEVDVVQLIEAIEQNTTLLELDLSHNCFGEECGKVLGTFISNNETLDSIDLSWNNFRGQSAIDMINGIKENSHLKYCNLEMNGFGPVGGQILADCIKQNCILEEFNISANRLNTTNAFAIAEALSSNQTLQILKIADNQINSDGVLAIFLCIKANEANKLREIDFSHTVVTQETLNICEDIVNLKNGQFQYHIGKVTPEKLQSNSTSEIYIKTNEEVLNKLRSTAANVNPNVN